MRIMQTIADDVAGDDGRSRPPAALERVAFIRIHATRSSLSIAHVREARNRFPLSRDVL
jgi:hypothetical protein